MILSRMTFLVCFVVQLDTTINITDTRSFVVRRLVRWSSFLVPRLLSIIPCSLSVASFVVRHSLLIVRLLVRCLSFLVPCSLSFIPLSLSVIPCSLFAVSRCWFVPRSMSVVPRSSFVICLLRIRFRFQFGAFHAR